MAANSNPSYFGNSPTHQSFDLTSMVDEVEGQRRNLPQIQFEIQTRIGKRVFVKNYNTPNSNPSYYGYTPVHQSLDLTSMVDEVDGERRNLPQIQFAISTPNGKRVFVTYRSGLDGIAAPPPAATALRPFTVDTTLITVDSTLYTADQTVYR